MLTLPTINFTLTTVIFYWLYLLVLLFYVVMAFFNIYHLIKFGPRSLVNYAVILLFLVVSFMLISASLTLFITFDWNTPIFNSAWFSNMGGLIKPSTPAINLEGLMPDIKL